MDYLFKGNAVTRTTVDGVDVVLVPNEPVTIEGSNDYISDLVAQRLLITFPLAVELVFHDDTGIINIGTASYNPAFMVAELVDGDDSLLNLMYGNEYLMFEVPGDAVELSGDVVLVGGTAEQVVDAINSFKAAHTGSNAVVGAAFLDVLAAANGTDITDNNLINREVKSLIKGDGNTKNTGYTKPYASDTLTFDDGTTVVTGEKITLMVTSVPNP